MIGVVIILALVQGLTEFLPVSSSGHLVLLNKFFGIENDFLLLSVILHVATLFSVVWVLRREVWEVARRPFGEMGRKLIFASVPTVLIVLLFKGFIDKSFDGGLLPFCFMFTAVLIVVSEVLNRNALGQKTKKNKKINVKNCQYLSKNSGNLGKDDENCNIKDCNDLSNNKNVAVVCDCEKKGKITKKTAIFMGVAQGIATLPGISRSGSTICAGLTLGKSRKEVAHFSFLMSIPIILASLVFEVYEYVSSGQALTLSWIELAVGFVVALITGIFAVKFMLRVIEKHSLIPFAVYLAVISVASFFVI